MGQRGSERAKEAARMVITDDNFAALLPGCRVGLRGTPQGHRAGRRGGLVAKRRGEPQAAAGSRAAPP